MKTLETNANGGFPFELNDLRWQHEGVKEALKALTQGIGNDQSFILWGINLYYDSSTNTYVWENGYIVLRGEICKVDFGELTSNQKPYWDYAVEYDLEGQKTFQNGSTNNTYKETKATLAFAIRLPANAENAFLPTLMELITKKAVNSVVSAPWTNLTLLDANWSATEPVSFRKNKLGYIELKGVVLLNNIRNYTAGGVLGVLPIDYRPIRPYVFNAIRKSTNQTFTPPLNYISEIIPFIVNIDGTIKHLYFLNTQSNIEVGAYYDFGFQLIPPH